MRSYTLRCTVAVFAVFSIPAVATAKPPAQPPPSEYAFDDHMVGGDTVAPDGEILQVRRKPSRESLIRARESFVAELLKSVEQL